MVTVTSNCYFLLCIIVGFPNYLGTLYKEIKCWLFKLFEWGWGMSTRLTRVSWFSKADPATKNYLQSPTAPGKKQWATIGGMGLWGLSTGDPSGFTSLQGQTPDWWPSAKPGTQTPFRLFPGERWGRPALPRPGRRGPPAAPSNSTPTSLA